MMILLVFVSVSCLTPVLQAQQKAGSQLRYTAGIITGYNRGYSILGNITAKNFDKDFPVQLRLGLGLNFINPGNALDARRIFINNNTNGTPEKKGHSFDFKLDFMLSKDVWGIEDSFFAFGPRFSTFVGDFKYVGGNEDFEVRSHQWGIGGDLENHFRMVGNLELVLNYGLDFYFPSSLTGHDTTYSPDNDNVNPNEDNQNNDVLFRYRDADKAIKQPRFMPHIMLGINITI